jgi:hypothetical protein
MIYLVRLNLAYSIKLCNDISFLDEPLDNLDFGYSLADVCEFKGLDLK